MKTKQDHIKQTGNTIALTWSGKEWQAKCAVPTERLIPGYSLTIPLPEAALKPDPLAEDRRLLFAKDTFLYLPLRAVRNQDDIDLQIAKHFHEQGKNPPSGNKSYIPIQLLEDLCVQKSRGSDNWRTCQCKCQILGNDRIFPSLNQLASYALRLWSDREAATIDVFQGVYFYHSRKYWQLDHMRESVVHGNPPPVNSDPGENTPPLPGLDKFL